MHDGHDHNGEHNHHHHDHFHCSEEIQSKSETQALLAYMLSHNEHHEKELIEMAGELRSMGMNDAASLLDEGIESFKAGNEKLYEALKIVVSKEG